jgi:hypothetical protein
VDSFSGSLTPTGYVIYCRYTNFFLSSSTDRSKVSDPASLNFPVDAPPTRKMLTRQGNNPTDWKMLFPCRSSSVRIFLSVNRQENYFLFFPVGFLYFTVGFVPTGNFPFPVVTLSTQCTRKTYLTSGNNFPTLKDMIGGMACCVSFVLRKALLIVRL